METQINKKTKPFYESMQALVEGEYPPDITDRFNTLMKELELGRSKGLARFPLPGESSNYGDKIVLLEIQGGSFKVAKSSLMDNTIQITIHSSVPEELRDIVFVGKLAEIVLINEHGNSPEEARSASLKIADTYAWLLSNEQKKVYYDTIRPVLNLQGMTGDIGRMVSSTIIPPVELSKQNYI